MVPRSSRRKGPSCARCVDLQQLSRNQLQHSNLQQGSAGASLATPLAMHAAPELQQLELKAVLCHGTAPIGTMLVACRDTGSSLTPACWAVRIQPSCSRLLTSRGAYI